jgi:hypothetical protein
MQGSERVGRARLTRRRFLSGASALLAGGAAGVANVGRASAAVELPRVHLAEPLMHLPARQHAWSEFLRRDDFGNPLAPRFNRLLFFDVRGRPTPAYAGLLESRLRTLEHHFRWAPDGLLFTVSYGPAYFAQVLGIPSPIPAATRLSSFEAPAFDRWEICLHLAGDDERRLAEVEAALVRGRALAGVAAAGSLTLQPILIWRETRTGFTGAGIPAARQRVRGIPSGDPVSFAAPLFMGFRSGLRKNQASEDDVTIRDGAFVDGTTMQVSYMRLQLDDWYGQLTPQDRVARMYSPQTSVGAVTRFTTDAPGNPGEIAQAITRYGVVGHAQATAQARRHGRPLIIRRDFDTVDGGFAGLHFVSLQRSVEDFVATRNAMNATGAHNVSRAIGATRNNGINAFIDVRRRANYVMPSRADRAFPLLRRAER